MPQSVWLWWWSVNKKSTHKFYVHFVPKYKKNGEQNGRNGTKNDKKQSNRNKQHVNTWKHISINATYKIFFSLSHFPKWLLKFLHFSKWFESLISTFIFYMSIWKILTQQNVWCWEKECCFFFCVLLQSQETQEGEKTSIN